MTERETAAMTDPGKPAYALSEDRMTLVVKRRAPGGIRDRHPATAEAPGRSPTRTWRLRSAEIPETRRMQPGQRNRTRRAETRFGTVWTRLMLGPPTWWLPKLRRKRDGTLMAGWIRLAVAVKLEAGREEG